MSAIRLPLLCAFAGGCLSNALLFGLWRAADGAGTLAAKPQHQTHYIAQPAAVASAAPTVEPAPEAATEPAPILPARDVDTGVPAPAGSAVSDVLMQLEAAYRERVPAQAPPAPEPAAAPAAVASAAREPAPNVPPAAAATMPAVPAAASVAPEARAVAAAPVAPAAVARQAFAEPALAAPGAPPPLPSEIHYGDVNQNTYITNVRQGDVYLIQMQQLAMLQYLQLLGVSGASAGAAAPGRHLGGAARQRTAFPSGITNPDNPWGFHFAPPNLVR